MRWISIYSNLKVPLEGSPVSYSTFFIEKYCCPRIEVDNWKDL